MFSTGSLHYPGQSLLPSPRFSATSMSTSSSNMNSKRHSNQTTLYALVNETKECNSDLKNRYFTTISRS